MKNNKETYRKYFDNIVELLSSLSEEDRYYCIAEIPGPRLEMRSGTLPPEMSAKKLRGDLIEYFNMSNTRLKQCTKELDDNFSVSDILHKINKVAYDKRSRNVLLKCYMKSYIHKVTKKSVFHNKSDKLNKVRLRVNDKKVKLVFPDELVSIGLLWEVYVEKVYSLKNKVDCIYDLGANIGLSASYFNAIDICNKIVCVEPMDDNANILRKNVRLNEVNAQILNVAAGDKNEETKIYFSDQSHALPSLYNEQAESKTVTVKPLDEIVTSDNYALKIDIEGGEEAFGKYEAIIENAQFIVGEIHYSADVEKNRAINEFYQLILKHFDVEQGRPTIYFVGDSVEMCFCYRTLAKKKIDKK